MADNLIASKTDLIVMHQSVKAKESQLNRHTCNTIVLSIPKNILNTITRSEPVNSTIRIITP